jgi:hypothetical protein
MVSKMSAADKRRAVLLCSTIAVALWPQLSMAQPPSGVFGSYAGLGCPTTGDTEENCIPMTATDQVRISRGKDSDATVKIRMVFDKGHTCALESKATWSDGGFAVRTQGLDPNKPCQLELRITGSILTLHDPEGLCREVYCGTRGAFDGARFKKKKGSGHRAEGDKEHNLASQP